jgi:hypothetical protein
MPPAIKQEPVMLSKFTAKEVGEWMVEQLIGNQIFFQETTACEIRERFGPSFIYIHDNGNLAIKKDVLAVFRKLTGDTIVWDQGERLWRKRGRPDKASPTARLGL